MFSKLDNKYIIILGGLGVGSIYLYYVTKKRQCNATSSNIIVTPKLTDESAPKINPNTRIEMNTPEANANPKNTIFEQLLIANSVSHIPVSNTSEYMPQQILNDLDSISNNISNTEQSDTKKDNTPLDNAIIMMANS